MRSSHTGVIQPGKFFCLRQKGEVQASQLNPLQPHFLVYVQDSGEVRHTFAQPKQILEIYGENAPTFK